MGSASLAAARPTARTVTTIPLQPGGLRGKNCCVALIQMLLVLFPIAMNRSSGYNPICCPAISAKLRCFEIPCQVEKVARCACARIPDVTVP